MTLPALPICLLPRRGGDKEPLAWGEADDGGLVHISGVPSGLKCACLCPGCGARLVARKGTIVEHHFAHYRTAPCKHAYESALHKLAKEVLDGERTMLLPKVGARLDRQELTTHEQAIYQFDDAVLEHRLDQIVPDVIVRKGRSRLLVEIYVTHACGPEKIERIRALGLSCVEVDLSRLPRDAGREEVKDALLGAAPREWVYNPKVEQAHALLRQTIARQEEEQRQVALRNAGARAAKIAKVVRVVARIRADPPPQDESDTAAIRAVAKAGFTSAIGHALPGDECLALPVDCANARAIDKETQRIAAERAAEAVKEAAERAGRCAAIEKDARMALGDEAEAWLASTQPGLAGTSPMASAEASIDGYYSASDRLAEAARVRSMRLDRERLRKRLLNAADGARKPAHARLFLTSPNPAWHNRHPIESCVDETSFERLRRAMIEVAR